MMPKGRDVIAFFVLRAVLRRVVYGGGSISATVGATCGVVLARGGLTIHAKIPLSVRWFCRVVFGGGIIGGSVRVSRNLVCGHVRLTDGATCLASS